MNPTEQTALTVTGLKIQYMFDIEDGVEPRKIK